MSMRMSSCGYTMSGHWWRRYASQRCWPPRRARELVMTGRPWQVRWYYDVWTLLPGVQRGLWARGVIAVNEAGTSAWPTCRRFRPTILPHR